MTDIALALAVHVVAVVLWIGGVSVVATVLMPAIRRSRPPEERFAAFRALESRFAHQARITTVLAGASGLYMVWRLNAWSWFNSTATWWMPAMVLIWLIFSLMLFVIEPFFLDSWLARRAASSPAATFLWMRRLHHAVLASPDLALTHDDAVADQHFDPIQADPDGVAAMIGNQYALDRLRIGQHPRIALTAGSHDAIQVTELSKVAHHVRQRLVIFAHFKWRVDAGRSA